MITSNKKTETKASPEVHMLIALPSTITPNLLLLAVFLLSALSYLSMAGPGKVQSGYFPGL